ncbi:MarR family winged helix-turn-helix transcriptional regulator [Sphingobacterium corticis]|uniref:MarR family winged helix-turn-helix transcriptional regulator n=1 Tax=Sphingobacterium corticis TaxID=1812823 RepID=A0ABW5NL53_9SPHI
MGRLEDNIKARKFSSEWHKATVNIVYTHNWLSNLLEERANKFDITLQQFNVLRILRGQYPNPVKNSLLRDRMITKTSDISRLIDRIITKELVSRTSCQNDKRAVDLLITQKGLDLLETMEDEMMLIDILPKNLTKNQCIELNKLLDKIRGKDAG